MSDQPPQLSPDEIAALEAELERITVDDVLLQTIVSLLNIGARKAGLAGAPGEERSADWPQVQLAIEGARALLPLLEPRHGAELAPVRNALSQLQLVYAQRSGAAAGAGPGAGGAQAGSGGPGAGGGEPPAQGEGPGPAQKSGRLWIPGQ